MNPTLLTAGASSLSICSHLVPVERPVALPPRRANLSTRPWRERISYVYEDEGNGARRQPRSRGCTHEYVVYVPRFRFDR
jgi:hypothetical protein